MPGGQQQGAETNSDRGLWRRIRDGAAEDLGKFLFASVVSAAALGAVTAWGALKTWVIAEIPAGVVVASTQECRELKGGWSSFEVAGGRFIIGAGPHPTAPDVNKVYEVYKKDGVSSGASVEKSMGGSETHTLTQEEMPKHSHELTLLRAFGDTMQIGRSAWSSDNGNITNEANTYTASTNQAGSSKPHSIIPPYIALYYCIKT